MEPTEDRQHSQPVNTEFLRRRRLSEFQHCMDLCATGAKKYSHFGGKGDSEPLLMPILKNLCN